MKHVALAMFLAGCGGPVADGAAAWDAGEQEHALEVWQEAASEGTPSGVLLYDLGIAWFRRGDLPRAVAAFRAARRLRPRDGQLAHNLAFARARLDGTPNPAPAAAAWMELLTPGEMGLAGAGVLVVAAVGAALRRGPRWVWVVAFVVGALLGAVSVHGATRDAAHPVAVVLDAPAGVRDVPVASAPTHDALQPGSEVRVVRAAHGFLLIELADGGRGWVPAGTVLLADPARIGTGG